MPDSHGRRSPQKGSRSFENDLKDTAAPGLEFRVLGPLEVFALGKPLDIRGARQRAVLAQLLLAEGRVVSAESIVAQVWDGRPPNTGRAQVSISIAALRKLFRMAGVTDEVIKTVSPGYQLPTLGCRFDLLEFRRRVEDGYELVRQGRREAAAAALRQGLALWRGSALDGVPAQFAEMEAMNLTEQKLLATEQLMELRLELGEHRSLAGELTALLRANPLRENLRACLMLALSRTGRRAAALRAFREGRDLSVEELGLEPGAELQTIHKLILNNDPSVLPDPELQAAQAPVVRPPAQLPADSTPFLGRAEEMCTLDALLAPRPFSSSAPICFISGSPGVGKTALAVHWARRSSRRFPDGQLYVDMREAEGSGPEEAVRSILRRFLRGLGLPTGSLPESTEECAAQYRSVLADRRMLIVVDNATSFDQVGPLLPGDGRCCVLITGLHQFTDDRGSEGVRLSPLTSSASLALLDGIVGHGRLTAEPDAAAELVRLCVGLPLAIRAAGARLASKPHWKVRDLVERLSDEHRALATLSHGENAVRRSFDRAYRDLPREVAAVYGRLGGLPAAELNVRDGAKALDMDLAAAEDALELLVDRNLLEVVGRDRTGRPLYRFLGLLRLHAAEQYAREGFNEKPALRLTRHTRRDGIRTAAGQVCA